MDVSYMGLREDNNEVLITKVFGPYVRTVWISTYHSLIIFSVSNWDSG
jgi:hypothetical protein